MIQAAQWAFGAVLVGLQSGHIQTAIVTASRARGYPVTKVSAPIQNFARDFKLLL